MPACEAPRRPKSRPLACGVAHSPACGASRPPECPPATRGATREVANAARCRRAACGASRPPERRPAPPTGHSRGIQHGTLPKGLDTAEAHFLSLPARTVLSRAPTSKD
eukprot:12422629-Alexandrium_andersonii.AAC.1